jgi:hypothetical protein
VVSIKSQCEAEDWVYTVEFSGGNDIQIAEQYLEKYEEEERDNPSYPINKKLNFSVTL